MADRSVVVLNEIEERLEALQSGDRAVIHGDLLVQGNVTYQIDEIVEGTVTVDVTDGEALLVRKNGDGGDVFSVDTLTDTVNVTGDFYTSGTIYEGGSSLASLYAPLSGGGYVEKTGDTMTGDLTLSGARIYLSNTKNINWANAAGSNQSFITMRTASDDKFKIRVDSTDILILDGAGVDITGTLIADTVKTPFVNSSTTLSLQTGGVDAITIDSSQQATFSQLATFSNDVNLTTGTLQFAGVPLSSDNLSDVSSIAMLNEDENVSGQWDFAQNVRIGLTSSGSALQLHGENLDVDFTMGHTLSGSPDTDNGFIHRYLGTGNGQTGNLYQFIVMGWGANPEYVVYSVDQSDVPVFDFKVTPSVNGTDISVTGHGHSSDDLSDVDSIAMLDENENITGTWSFIGVGANWYNASNTTQRYTINVTSTTHPRIYNYDQSATTFHPISIGGTNSDSTGIYIDGAGQVGIGTSTLTEILTVSGNIAVSGTVDGVDIAGLKSQADDTETNLITHASTPSIHFTQANITTVGTLTAGSIPWSLLTDVPSYDNYGSWVLIDEDDVNYVISSGEAVQIKSGLGLTSAYSSASWDNEISIALGTPSTVTGATTNSVSGTTHSHELSISSDDLSDVSSIAMLDENETVTGAWSFSETVTVKKDVNTSVGYYVENLDTGTSAQSLIRLYTNDGYSYFINHATSRVVTRYGTAVGGWTELLAQDSTGGLMLGTGTANTNIILGVNDTVIAAIDKNGFDIANGVLKVGGAQITSSALSDVSSIAMLDEAETVSSAWTFSSYLDMDGTAIRFGSAASGMQYSAQESSLYSNRYFILFDHTDDASFPYLTNRTPNGKVEIWSGTTAGGAEIQRMSFAGGDGDQSITLTNVDQIIWGSETISPTQIGYWDDAYSWGDHAGLYSDLGHTHTNSEITDLNTDYYNKQDVDDILLSYVAIADIDDTPVNGVTGAPISSNWAYDHVNAADPHSVYPLAAGNETISGEWTFSNDINITNSKSIDMFDGGTGFYHQDARHNATDLAPWIHKYRIKDGGGYVTYMENWYDGSAYHALEMTTSAFKVSNNLYIAGDITLSGTVDGVDIAGLSSDDLSDVASIAMLDENETVTGIYTFSDKIYGTNIPSGQHWQYDDITSANISLELGQNATNGTGSIKLWSYTADEFVFMRPSNGNFHIDSTTGKYYFNWDDALLGGIDGAIYLGNAAGTAGISLNASTTSIFTSGATFGNDTTVTGTLTVNNGGILVSPNVAGDGGWDEGIVIDNTAADGEAAISFRTTDMGSNYWIAGSNQGTDYKLAYGTSFTDLVTVLTLSSTGSLTIDGSLALGGTVDGVDIAALNTAVAKTADNETITGTWTFNNTISGSIDGDADSVDGKHYADITSYADTAASGAVATHSALTTGIHGVTGTLLGSEDVDDTPVNGVTGYPISSNWAYGLINGTVEVNNLRFGDGDIISNNSGDPILEFPDADVISILPTVVEFGDKSDETEGRGLVIERHVNTTNGESSARIFWSENNDSAVPSNNDKYGISWNYQGDTTVTFPSGAVPANGNATWSFKRHDASLDGTDIMYGTRASNNVTFTGIINLTNDADEVAFTSAGKLTRVGDISLDWNGSYNNTSYHGISSRNGSGSLTDDIKIASYDDIFIMLDTNNNDSTSGLYVYENGQTTSSGTLIFKVETSGHTYIKGNLTIDGTVDGKDIANNAAMINETETITGDWTFSATLNTAQLDASGHIYTDGRLYLGGGTAYYTVFDASSITAGRTMLLPDADGTFATQEWVNLQGFLTSETDSQTLSYTASTGSLSISNGNSVDIGVGTGDSPTFTALNLTDKISMAHPSDDIIMRVKDSGDTYSIFMTVNDGQGNFNIMTGIDDSGNFTESTDGAAKILYAAHSQDGGVSLNAAKVSGGTGAVSFSIGLLVDSTDNSIRVGASSDNLGMYAGDGTKIADASGNLYDAGSLLSSTYLGISAQASDSDTVDGKHYSEITAYADTAASSAVSTHAGLADPHSVYGLIAGTETVSGTWTFTGELNTTNQIDSQTGNSLPLFTHIGKNSSSQTTNTVQYGGAQAIGIPGATDRYEQGFLINTGATPRNWFVKATTGTVRIVSDQIYVTTVYEGGSTLASQYAPIHAITANNILLSNGSGGFTDSALQPDAFSLKSDIDDTPVDGETSAPISSNWAYDHANATNPHSITKSTIGLGSVENTALSTWAGSTNITTLGTITTGVWNSASLSTLSGTDLYILDSAASAQAKIESAGASSWAGLRLENTSGGAWIGLYAEGTGIATSALGQSLADASYIYATNNSGGLIINENIAAPIFLGTNNTLAMTIEADQDVLMEQDLDVKGEYFINGVNLASSSSLYEGGTKLVDIYLTLTDAASTYALQSTTMTAGNGLTGGGSLASNRTFNVGAGTGIDVAADSISVDVSDFMTNGANNRIVTATGTDAMNAEAALTFDGASLYLDSGTTASMYLDSGTGSDAEFYFSNLGSTKFKWSLDVDNSIGIGAGDLVLYNYGDSKYVINVSASTSVVTINDSLTVVGDVYATGGGVWLDAANDYGIDVSGTTTRLHANGGIIFTADGSTGVLDFTNATPTVGGGTATLLTNLDVDDTPVDGATTAPISSNWAYDYLNSAATRTGSLTIDGSPVVFQNVEGSDVARFENQTTANAKMRVRFTSGYWKLIPTAIGDGTPDYAREITYNYSTREWDIEGSNIITAAAVDDTPVDGETTVPVSSNWAYDHAAATTDVHSAAGYGQVGVAETVSANWRFSGTPTFDGNIIHTGDGNTGIQFTDDRVRLVAGGTTYFDTNSGVPVYASTPVMTGTTSIQSNNVRFRLDSTDTSVALDQEIAVIETYTYDPSETLVAKWATVADQAYASGAQDTRYAWYLMETSTLNEQMRLTNTGHLHVEDNITAYSTTISSDRRLKDNIRDIDNGLDIIMGLRPVRYNYKEEFFGLERSLRDRIGLIAQEAEAYLPEVVQNQTLPLFTGDNQKEYKTIDYDQLTPMAIAAIQQQQKMIEALQAEVAELKTQIGEA